MASTLEPKSNLLELFNRYPLAINDENCASL
jgi:hypothetical protein